MDINFERGAIELLHDAETEALGLGVEQRGGARHVVNRLGYADGVADIRVAAIIGKDGGVTVGKPLPLDAALDVPELTALSPTFDIALGAEEGHVKARRYVHRRCRTAEYLRLEGVVVAAIPLIVDSGSEANRVELLLEAECNVGVVVVAPGR